jgi:hypothetical protein
MGGRPKGLPKSGGRQKGTVNKKNAPLAKLLAQGDTRELPHELLLRVSRGGDVDGHAVTFEERLMAAKDAGPYYAPKLAATDNTHKHDVADPLAELLKWIDQNGRRVHDRS